MPCLNWKKPWEIIDLKRFTVDGGRFTENGKFKQLQT